MSAADLLTKSRGDHHIAVLLVEDSATEIELIRKILANSTIGNYTLVSAVSLAEARILLAGNPVDLIILDLDLPDSQGLETLQAILRQAPQVPAIVLTDNDDQVLGRNAILLGARDFITKNSEAESLLPHVAYYTLARHKAQMLATRSELFLRTTIDSLPNPIAIVDRQGQVLLINRNWMDEIQAASGTRNHIFTGRNYFTDFLPVLGTDQATSRHLMRQTSGVITRQLEYFEDEYISSGLPEERWFQVRITPLLTTFSESVVITHLDITRRKRTEEDLIKSREYLRRIFDTSPNLVFVRDERSRYVMVNQAIASLYGTSPRNMIGKTDVELMAATGSQLKGGVLQAEKDTLVINSNESIVVDQEPLIDNGGMLHWYRTVRTPIQFPSCPTYVLSIATDITNDRSNQEKTRNSELLLRTTLNAIQHRIAVMDPAMRIIWANNQALNYAGCSLDELIGKNCKGICQPQDQCRNCAAAEAVTTRKIQTRRHNVGSSQTFEVTGCPILDADDTVTGVVWIAEDISERLSMEQQLRQAQKMESLGVLAGGIAHDFNNILTAILGFTELAQLKVPNDSSLEADLHEVHQASLRARDLVSQILTFSRRIEQELHPLDISRVIEEVLKMLKASLPSTIRIVTSFEDNPGQVLADPTQIHQIVMNLCTNAAHAMTGNGGLLKLSLKKRLLESRDIDRHSPLKPGRYIEFTVEDTGHGIPEEILPYIFDPYFTTKEAGAGTGLGLAVVHGIINDYGGAIAVTSQPGEGSVFTIHLPVTATQELTTPDTIQTPDSLSGHGEQILVVDDEQAILMLCTRVLERAGYTVRTETDPRAAFSILRENPRAVDLILCDLTMPHLTGDKLAMLVHEVAPALPIILMSGNRVQLEESQAGNGVILRIPKPINNNSLLEMISVLLLRTATTDPLQGQAVNSAQNAHPDKG